MNCIVIKSNGEPCKMHALEGSDYCWAHSPHISAQVKKAACSKGGSLRIPDQSLIKQNLPLATTGDISALLADTIMNLRKGIFNSRVSTAIGYLSFIMVRTIELTEAEKRLEELENRLNNFDYITIHPEFKNVQPQDQKN
ncbi:MAG: hypothetical protein ABSF32_07395 [Ignavibacteria bacterium]